MEEEEILFNDFKIEIIKRCKEKSACKSEFTKVLESTNFNELVKVLTANFNWCCENKIIDVELLEPLNEVIIKYGLCANVKEVSNCFILLNGSSTAELYGSSTAELYDSGKAELYGSSTAILHDLSTAILHDSSRAELYDSGKAELYGSGKAKLYGSSTAKLYCSSTAELYDSSTAELYDSSYAISCNNLECKLNDNAILRYYYDNKIIVSKNTKIETY